MESSAGVLLPSVHLGSPREDLYDCLPKAPQKVILYILDNTHLKKQGLLSVQFGVSERICKHNCGHRINKYYCAEAFIKYEISRYSLTTSKESVLLRSIRFSASWVQSPPTGLGFFVSWCWVGFFFPHPKEWKPTCSDSYPSVSTTVKISYHRCFSWASCWIANAICKQKQVREGTSTGLAGLLKFKAGV